MKKFMEKFRNGVKQVFSTLWDAFWTIVSIIRMNYSSKLSLERKLVVTTVKNIAISIFGLITFFVTVESVIGKGFMYFFSALGARIFKSMENIDLFSGVVFDVLSGIRNSVSQSSSVLSWLSQQADLIQFPIIALLVLAEIVLVMAFTKCLINTIEWNKKTFHSLRQK